MLTYTFTLEDDLKWSDGSPFTAEDFVYSWKRAAAAETAADYAYMLEGIKGYPDDLAVTASEDGKVLTVELSSPCAYFLDLCAFPTFFPVQKDFVESAEGFKDADGNIKDAGAWATEAGFVGNGPYTLETWNHKESMTYVKNPNYHRADEVTMDNLNFMLSSDATAVYAAYQAGDLDFIDTIPSDEMANAQQSDEFYKIDQLGTYYANFNVNSPLFEGKHRLRLTLCAAPHTSSTVNISLTLLPRPTKRSLTPLFRLALSMAMAMNSNKTRHILLPRRHWLL